MSTEPEWLTLKEFARRTHYAVQTVYNKISNGELGVEHGVLTMPGGRHRIDWSIWREWVQAQRDGSAPAASAK